MKVNHHTSTRIPLNDEYVTLVGKATYMFAYYEWTIIYIIDSFRSGFVSQYSRPTGKPLTSGAVDKKFQEIILQTQFPFSSVTELDINNCQVTFRELIEKRNALIHAHPMTDTDGSQILGYQTKLSKPISDMIWRKSDIEELIKEIDKAAIDVGTIFEKLRK